MFDLSKFSTQYNVRYMSDSDADEILAFCLQNEQYYRYCGKQPSRELILRDLHITPPNTPAEAKYYVGYYEENNLVAVMDLIDGYPDNETAFIGFFMAAAPYQGRGTGTAIISELCAALKEQGFEDSFLGNLFDSLIYRRK